MNATTQESKTAFSVVNKEQLLAHWQGHRNLTRKLIETFPEKDFFEFSIGGMRTMAEMAMELIAIAGPGLQELIEPGSADFKESFEHQNKKESILKKWDEQTPMINELWEKLPKESFENEHTVFGEYKGTGLSHIFYYIDNEIHHRAQGYVYLRALGIQPPFFWERD